MHSWKTYKVHIFIETSPKKVIKKEESDIDHSISIQRTYFAIGNNVRMCLFLFHYSQLTSRQNIVNFRIAVHQLTPRAMKQPSLSSAESGLLFIWRWKHNSFFQLINMWNSRAHICSNKMKKKHSQPTTNIKFIENLALVGCNSLLFWCWTSEGTVEITSM